MGGSSVKKKKGNQTAQSRARKPKSDGRAAALAADINTTLALGSPVRLGSDPKFQIHRIPTGSLVLDRITGGGFALGRHYELYGDESVGKSYIVYRTMALSQARGNLCAVVDPEHSFDSDRFAYLGGNPADLLMFWPENADDSISVMMLLAKHAQASEIEVIGIDSVASMLTSEEAGKDPREKDQPATQARMMSRALRRITTVNQNTLFLWTNQERVNVGVSFGNPKTTSGGRALRYYATGRLEFRRGTKVVAKAKKAKAAKLVETEIEAGRWIQVKAVKDKSTRPGREGSFVFDYLEKRISMTSEIVQLGLEDGLITRAANGRYTYEGIEDTWTGTYKDFTRYLTKNAELCDELVTAIEDVTQRVGDDGA